MKRVIGITIPGAIAWGMPFFVIAAAAGVTGVTSVQGFIDNVICKIFAYMFVLFMIIAVIMVLWAAYLYLFSQGDAEKVGKASKVLTFVAVAVVIAILSKTVPILIGDLVGVSGRLPGCS